MSGGILVKILSYTLLMAVLEEAERRKEEDG
jgi:hypothetical protein